MGSGHPTLRSSRPIGQAMRPDAHAARRGGAGFPRPGAARPACAPHPCRNKLSPYRLAYLAASRETDKVLRRQQKSCASHPRRQRKEANVYSPLCFFSLTPGPSPFCSMNMTPAVSKAARIAFTVRGLTASPRSNRTIVSVETPEWSDNSLTPKPVAVRAILHCMGRISEPCADLSCKSSDMVYS